MSDFFTKKQRKFWCETCKIFIEYTKIVIDQHNRSKNHIRLLGSDSNYRFMKNKIARHNLYNFGIDNENTENLKQEFLKNKINRSSSGYGYDNSTDNGLNNKLLEEIKKEKRIQMVKENSEKNGKDGKEKNSDIIQIKKDLENESNKTEGTIGKWEIIEKSKTENNINNTPKEFKIPGVITYAEYLDLINENEETSINQFPQIKKITNKFTIDQFINNDSENLRSEKKSWDLDIGNQNIVNINKELKKHDYDVKFVNQLYIDQESQSFTKNDLKFDGNLTITFNSSKKNNKKISNIFKDDDSD